MGGAGFTRAVALGLEETMRRAGDFTIVPEILLRSCCARGTETVAGSFAGIVVGFDTEAEEADSETLIRR